MDSLDCKTRLSSLEFRVAQLEKMLQDQLVLQQSQPQSRSSPPKISQPPQTATMKPVKPPMFQLNDDVRYWIIEMERYLSECRFPAELWVSYARKFTNEPLSRYVKSLQAQSDPNVQNWERFKTFLVDTYGYVHPEKREEVKLESCGPVPTRYTPVQTQSLPIRSNECVGVGGRYNYSNPPSRQNAIRRHINGRLDYRRGHPVGTPEADEGQPQTPPPPPSNGFMGRSGPQRGMVSRGPRTTRAFRRFGM